MKIRIEDTVMFKCPGLLVWMDLGEHSNESEWLARSAQLDGNVSFLRYDVQK